MFQIVAVPLVILIYILTGMLICLFLVDFIKSLRKSAEVRAAFVLFIIGAIAVISFMEIVF